MERNTAGQLTSDTVSGEAHAEIGLIDHIRNLDRRVREIEVKLFPQTDGSGTGRYPDNWTQTGDGTDYPGSYGVGLDLGAGDSVRVIDGEGGIDNTIRTVKAVGKDTVIVDSGATYPRNKVVRANPPAPSTAQQDSSLKPFNPFVEPAGEVIHAPEEPAPIEEPTQLE